jgi:hypothetical protein
MDIVKLLREAQHLHRRLADTNNKFGILDRSTHYALKEAEYKAAADELEKAEPVAFVDLSRPGPMDVGFYENTEFGTQLEINRLKQINNKLRQNLAGLSDKEAAG